MVFIELAVEQEHFYVKFGDPSCIGVCDIVRIKSQTNIRPSKLYPAPAVGVGNY